MNIRPETPHDYAAIAGVNLRAFGERAAEALIVALHRHRAAFDPELSLVAEEGGSTRKAKWTSRSTLGRNCSTG
jgi:predicted N-acetyltransferase YhbS